MENMNIDKVMKTQKHLDELLEYAWKNELKCCENMNNVIHLINNGFCYKPDFMNELKELILFAFQIGYNHGLYDYEKPYKDAQHEEHIRILKSQSALIDNISKKLNTKEIHWYTGNPTKSGCYLTTRLSNLKNSKPYVLIDTWKDIDFPGNKNPKWENNVLDDSKIIAWADMNEIKPYKY